MDMDDLILVSVDDHVVEPPDVFEKHLPAKYQEFAPKLKEREDGTLAWYYYEHEITNVGLNAVAGRPRRSTASSRPASTRCARAAGTSTSASRT